MDGQLHSIAYFSRNQIEAQGGDLMVQIDAILRAARVNNPAWGVTGALLFSQQLFAQVIEGPREAVEAMLARIEHDPRHSDVTVLGFQPIRQRSFPAWAMAGAGGRSDREAEGAINRFVTSPGALQIGAVGKAELRRLEAVLLRQEAESERNRPADDPTLPPPRLF